MRRFATGVAIVATVDQDRPYAASVNSLTSVSLEPPLILVCLKIGSKHLRGPSSAAAGSACACSPSSTRSTPGASPDRSRRWTTPPSSWWTACP
ncbi:flavin reductase [Streptosporangium vulgare]|uniref:flavin reductase n=1 Tax=Streptosporangium vulgare TaxID=46190 RepID=UPI0031D4DBD6